MEKKMWVAPQMEGMEFMAESYISACGDENEVYKFTCDAGKGVYGDVWLESNGIAGLQTEGQWIESEDHFLGGYWQAADNQIAEAYKSGGKMYGYHACGATHEASTSDAFQNGYYREYSSGATTSEGAIIPVIVWRGENNDNVHCTTNLDMDSWETAKS